MQRNHLALAMPTVALLALAPPSLAQQWRQLDPVVPQGGAAGDHFGGSVGTWGNRFVAGAPFHAEGGVATGAAYGYEYINSGWVEAPILLAADGADGDTFGHSVAMCTDTILVGAPGDDDNGDSSGAVYVFERDGAASWAPAGKLTPDDGAACDRFGWSVAVSGGVAVVGAWSDDAGCTGAHAAFIFERTESGWVQAAKVLPGSGDGSEQFAYSVSVSAGNVLVGAFGNDSVAQDAGAVYAYAKVSGVWTQTGLLVAADGEAGDHFGYAVAAGGSLGAIGAPGDADNGADSGSAYIFSRDANGWAQDAKVLAAEGAPGDRLGSSADITADWAVVGAPGYQLFEYNGAVIPFHHDGGAWVQTDPVAQDSTVEFGASVALSSHSMIVGDPLGDASGEASGAGYTFYSCFADFNLDGVVNTLDVLAYINAWASMDYRADCDGCGSVDTIDFLCFLNQWVTGCD